MGAHGDSHDLYDHLLDPRDPKQISAIGRVWHFAFCLIGSAGLSGVFVVGGLISMMFFEVISLYSLLGIINLLGEREEVGPMIWVPIAAGIGTLWIVLVAAPAVWIILNFLGCLLGMLSAAIPRVSTFDRVQRLADTMARVALYSAWRFKRDAPITWVLPARSGSDALSTVIDGQVVLRLGLDLSIYHGCDASISSSMAAGA